MALTKSVVTPQGFNAENAYHNIKFITIQGAVMTFSVFSCKDAASPPFQCAQVECAYDPDVRGGNPFKQAYAYLKAQPSFLGSTDS